MSRSPLKISIGLDLYDRHLPFFLGTVPCPAGVEVEALEVGMVPPRRHGLRRHARMLHGEEFDVCEVSLASYIMAKMRARPFTAIPVFPRRLFSQNHIFVRADAGIESAADLAGRRVAVWAFQVTMSVLAKGDLLAEHGVDWRRIVWVTEAEEEISWAPPPGVRVERSPNGLTGAELLLRGEVDAYIYPHPPHSILESGGAVRRLFPDTIRECERHFAKRRYYPIMHLLAVKQALAEREPWLLKELIAMWEAAKHVAADYYTDPGFSELAFASNELERQQATLGEDIWPSGLAANRKNLEDFIGYLHEQGLADRRLMPEELFHPSVLDT